MKSKGEKEHDARMEARTEERMRANIEMRLDRPFDQCVAEQLPRVPTKGPEKVLHPSHYNTGKFEVWDVLDDWFSDEPLLWQVGKYLARAKHKESFIEDLKKAQNYLARRIAQIEKENE